MAKNQAAIVLQAVQSAETALNEAKKLLAETTGQPATTTGQGSAPAANRSQGSQGSAGRLPSDAQQKVRDLLQAEINAGKVGLFTIKGLTESTKQDRVQVRNAVAYLESQGVVSRFAEKLPEGRGQRELIYKVAAFATNF